MGGLASGGFLLRGGTQKLVFSSPGCYSLPLQAPCRAGVNLPVSGVTHTILKGLAVKAQAVQVQALPGHMFENSQKGVEASPDSRSRKDSASCTSSNSPLPDSGCIWLVRRTSGFIILHFVAPALQGQMVCRGKLPNSGY